MSNKSFFKAIAAFAVLCCVVIACVVITIEMSKKEGPSFSDVEGYKNIINSIVANLNDGWSNGIKECLVIGLPTDTRKVLEAYNRLFPNSEKELYDDVADDYQKLYEKYRSPKFIFYTIETSILSEDELNDLEDKQETRFDEWYRNTADLCEYVLKEENSEKLEYAASVVKNSEETVRESFTVMKSFLESLSTVEFEYGVRVKGTLVFYDGDKEIDRIDETDIFFVQYNGEWVVADYAPKDERFTFQISKREYDNHKPYTSIPLYRMTNSIDSLCRDLYFCISDIMY